MGAYEGLKWAATMRTAYHEAGHAVVALATGYVLTEVAVSPTGGHAKLAWAIPDFRYLVCLVAGEVAVEVSLEHDPQDAWLYPADYFWGDGNDGWEFVSSRYARGEWDPRGEARDVDRAVPIARYVSRMRAAEPPPSDAPPVRPGPGPEGHAVLCEAERLALRVVCSNWAAVDTLARALAAAAGGRMTGDEVEGRVGEMVVEAPYCLTPTGCIDWARGP